MKPAFRLRLMLVAAFLVSSCSSQPNLVYTEWPFDANEAARRQDEAANALGIQKELILKLDANTTMTLTLIPAGKFLMGSPDSEKDRRGDEGPQHETTISKPFYMGVYTVTQEQYSQVTGKNRSRVKAATNPVEQVSWAEAVEFCKRLSARMGKTVQLPTEAQWEYACRAGTAAPFNTGQTLRPDQANYDANHIYGGVQGENRGKTTPVGSFKPNAFGLYDMHGNVLEWCSDWYDEKAYANADRTDPAGPAWGTERVLRGGAWYGYVAFCRSAYRCGFDPLGRDSGVGFRVVIPAEYGNPPAIATSQPSRPSATTQMTTARPAAALPAATSTAASSPAVAKTAATGPAASQPAVANPAATVSAVIASAITKPALAPPAATQSVAAPLVATRPAIARPSVTQPAASQPVAALPAVAQAAVTKPAPSKPASTQPTYPLWDGKEPVADYAKRGGINTVRIELTLDANITMKLTLIPPGKFLMGSPREVQVRLRNDAIAAGYEAAEWFNNEGPQHETTLSKPFFMAVTHVTKGQFAAFIRDSGYTTEAQKDGWAVAWDGSKLDNVNGASWKRPGFTQGDDHPVVCVSHNDAVAFCDWLGKKAGRTVALPTEAQWEYACRAGTTTAYPWGDDPNGGKGWCNAADQALKKTVGGNDFLYFTWDDGYAFTAPVGRFKPNAFGLNDMNGNAWQWCSDWWDGKPYANLDVVDPKGPAAGIYRVQRGGSWYDRPGTCRSATRLGTSPGARTTLIGFRVVVPALD